MGGFYGAETIAQHMETMTKTMDAKAERKVLTKQAVLLKRTQKKLAPKGTGLTKRAIHYKVSVKVKKKVALIGPRKGEVNEGGRLISPTRYAHLSNKRKPFINLAVKVNQERLKQIRAKEYQKFLAKGK